VKLVELRAVSAGRWPGGQALVSTNSAPEIGGYQDPLALPAFWRRVNIARRTALTRFDSASKFMLRLSRQALPMFITTAVIRILASHL
jgi:hypothetical protein